MVREYGGKFLRKKTRFFWDPLVVPFGLKAIFEDPQKSSMIFYRKDLTAKIMLRTHMLFLKLQYFVHTHTHRFLDVSHTIAPKGQKITLCCGLRRRRNYNQWYYY